MTLGEFLIKIADFLGTPIIGTNLFHLDYWTFIHLSTGFLGMWLIFKLLSDYDTKRKFAVLFLFVLLWEFFEFSSPLVREEPLTDIFYDFIVGFLGGYLYYKIRVFSQRQRYFSHRHLLK